jgi:hypothetical protein
MGYIKSGETTADSLNFGKFIAHDSRADDVAMGLYAHAVDSAPSSTNAFLISELEKRDPVIRQPLKAVTYPKNIGVEVGGGWVEKSSKLFLDYGLAGNSADSSVMANGATIAPVIQANFNKNNFSTHIWNQPLSINEFDILRQKVTGRSLETILTDGVRLAYDKHMDKNVFVGLSEYGTTGILNDPDVPVTDVAAGAGSSTLWTSKTPDEILLDINTAVTDVWANAGNDLSAIPNHVLLPFAQYNYIATTKVSTLAEKTILTFILENNISRINGSELAFGVSLYNAGAGANSKDRMAVYNMDKRFLAVEELQPLTRMYTLHNPGTLTYDSNYAANISQVEAVYPQTMGYFDGI